MSGQRDDEVDRERIGEVVEAAVLVVPAHDEMALLDRCLRHAAAAQRELRRRRPEIWQHTVVVLDRCTDGSAAIAAAHGCDGLHGHLGSVGAARAAGVARAREGVPDVDPARLWIATTDADSAVDPAWLASQVVRAESGCDLVLGPVVPDPVGIAADVLQRWHHHTAAHGTGVHGANLGVRASAYDAVGGFAAVEEHEDVLLVDALRHRGVRVGSCPPVITSARHDGRTPGGFAGFIRSLARDHHAPPGGEDRNHRRLTSSSRWSSFSPGRTPGSAAESSA